MAQGNALRGHRGVTLWRFVQRGQTDGPPWRTAAAAAVGAPLILVGLFWFVQGAGLLPWPRSCSPVD